MTLLSLFMTSTGIFCFVPISHRLVESGIIPPSNGWLPFAPTPTFYYARKNEHGLQFLLAAPDGDEAGGTFQPEAKEHFRHHNQTRSLGPQDPMYSATMREWGMEHTPAASPSLERSATPCTSQSVSPFVDTFYGHESASFVSLPVSDGTLCDDCDTLLRREIPVDHIPSVVRALALFEAQERLSSSVSALDITVQFDEGEVVALTDAFSMLRL